MSPRPPKYRFYLDENFPAEAGKFLRFLGHNVLNASDNASSRGITDLSQINFARKEKRIFVALDRDFKSNANLKGSIRKSLGVILIESADPRSQKVIKILKHLLDNITSNKLDGRICCASVDKIIYR